MNLVGLFDPDSKPAHILGNFRIREKPKLVDVARLSLLISLAIREASDPGREVAVTHG